MDIKTFNELRESKERTIVVLSAQWCGPCKLLGKTIDTIKDEAPNLSDKIHKLDVDDCEELVEYLGVQSVPSVYYLGHGEFKKSTGVQSASELLEWLIAS
jgi:thioredoxin 1